VVQECLKKGSAENVEKIIGSILNLNQLKVIDLMKHMYGNYVIQTALDVSNDTQKAKLVK